MPPKKRTHFDDKVDLQGDLADGEVSNKDLLKAIAELTTRMGDFENSMLTTVDEKIASLEKNIIAQVNDYKQGTEERVVNIEKRMDELVNKISVDVNAVIDEKCTALDHKVKETVATCLANESSGISEYRIDQLERQVRMNELVISGVPWVENEKLFEIIAAICRVIKFNNGADSIESCFRLPVRNAHRRSSPSIILKFWATDAKFEFFKQYFATKKLCTSMIGYSAPSRIYVNENLTKRNFEIFCKARDLKKEGKIARFNTQRGRVVVKLLGSDELYTVESMDKLSSLIYQPATASSMDH